MQIPWSGTQPFGVDDLETDAASRYRIGNANSLLKNDQIRCCVKGCDRWLARRRRGKISNACFCPVHHISVSNSPTYVYKDRRLNCIIDVAMFDAIADFKVESWRLGNERSEDTLSWNVFMALARLGVLKDALRVLTGVEVDQEPELYLWGVSVLNERPQVWSRLKEVRKAIEARAGLPTEPDIMLRVPGKLLVLIEAKFGSGNGTLTGQQKRFGSPTDFLAAYPSVEKVTDPLNRQWIKAQKPGIVLQQLVRNVVFAQHLAESGEQPFVVNLVRDADETDIAGRMAMHLAADSPVSFRRETWEGLGKLALKLGLEASHLTNYLSNKTSGLKPAFLNQSHSKDT